MKTIFTNLAPNTEPDDAELAAKLIFQPWKWKRGAAVALLEGELRRLLEMPYVTTVASGRTALSLILRALKLDPGDEVLLQAYTCVAVPDPLLWEEVKPVYVDCDAKTLSMSIVDLKEKITERSKAIILQHTFGSMGPIEEVLALAKKHNLIVIEDCAHALGGRHNNKPLGSFGDVSFFSFGRDKVISSVFGGAIAAKDPDLWSAIRLEKERLRLPSAPWVFQQLLHPVLMQAIKATYAVGVGKVILWLTRKLHILSRSVYPIERSGGKPVFVEHQYANALAILALHQLKKLSRFNSNRQRVARIYQRALENTPIKFHAHPESIYLRFLALHHDASNIRAYAAKQGILLGDWYTTPMAPAGVKEAEIAYDSHATPAALLLASKSFNLPTDIHISENDAMRVVNVVKEYLQLD